MCNFRQKCFLNHPVKCLNLCRTTTVRPYCNAQTHNFNMTPKSAQGKRRKEMGFQTGSRKAYNTPYKSTGKAFVNFQPIVIPHKFQTRLWQHDWWACHCECQEKWSLNLYLTVSHCVWDLRFMEEYAILMSITRWYQGHANLLSDETSAKVQFYYPCFILIHNRLKCPRI